MRLAIIGRTRSLLAIAERLEDAGHTFGLVWTCGAEGYYGAGPAAYAALARRHGAVFRDEPRINAAFEPGLAAGAALAVSLSWPTRIGAGVIEAFPQGVLNGHAGDLPRYRGTAAPNWAILNGEPHIGLCVHYMTPEYDSGAVLVRRRFPLGPDTYIGEFYAWSEASLPEMYRIAVDGLAAGTLAPEPESTVAPLHCYPRRPEDSRIRWAEPAGAIHRLVRASSRPFAGAFTGFQGRDLRVWRASPVPAPGRFCAVPGTVCHAETGDPVIACGDGLLRLEEITAAWTDDEAAAKREIARTTRNRLE